MGRAAAAVVRAGWPEPAVVQLAALCGAFAALNRLACGLGLVAAPDFAAAAGDRLARIGYDGTARLLGL